MNKSLKDWLEQDCNCFNVLPVVVEINGEKWGNCCFYKKELEYQIGMDIVSRGEKKPGDKYTEERIYCIGRLPKVKLGKKRGGGYGKKETTTVKENICFPYKNQDWYVAGYILDENLTKNNLEYHPFGVHFILAPWDIPNEKIDKYEEKPYTRYDMDVF